MVLCDCKQLPDAHLLYIDADGDCVYYVGQHAVHASYHGVTLASPQKSESASQQPL